MSLRILACPREPRSLIEAVGGDDSADIPRLWGADFLVPFRCDNRSGLAAIQRKEFPDDLLSSRADGRLAMCLQQMGAASMRLLIIEGRGYWSSEGKLMHYYSEFTQKQFWGLLFSIQIVHQVPVVLTDNIDDTALCIKRFSIWVNKQSHKGIVTRPKYKDPWHDPQSDLRKTWFLQGLPGIGSGVAKQIFDGAGGKIPMAWTLDPSNFKGVGKKRAQ